jgi:hypothetical protein
MGTNLTYWTPERREAYRQEAQRRKPWRQSTGGRSPEGVAISAQNARRHGFYGREHEVVRAYLKVIDVLQARF